MMHDSVASAISVSRTLKLKPVIAQFLKHLAIRDVSTEMTSVSLFILGSAVLITGFIVSLNVFFLRGRSAKPHSNHCIFIIK
jgi:hypothetical protein